MKKNYFKTLIAMTVFVVAGATIFVSCKEDDDKNNEKDDVVYPVSGTLKYSYTAEWTNVSASFDYGKSWAVTAPISDYFFSLELPTPDADFLYPLEKVEDLDGTTIKPIDAQGAFASFYARQGSKKDEIIQLGINSKDEILSMVSYVYIDRDASVTGTIRYSDGKVVFNLQLKKGWNTIINTWDYSSTMEEEYYDTGNVPSKTAWVTESDLSSSSPAATYSASDKTAGFGFKKVDKKIWSRLLK